MADQDGPDIIEPTYCESCAHCIVPGKDAPTWRWLCGATRRAKTGFVTRQFYDGDPPYHYCNRVNTIGNCEMFEAKEKK